MFEVKHSKVARESRIMRLRGRAGEWPWLSDIEAQRSHNAPQVSRTPVEGSRSMGVSSIMAFVVVAISVANSLSTISQ